MLLFYVNLFMTIYFGTIKPFKNRILNTIELYNELQVTFICYFTLIFTDFVPTVEQQYSGGWMMIYLVIALLAANMLVVLRTGAENIGLVYLKYYNIFENWWRKVQN